MIDPKNIFLLVEDNEDDVFFMRRAFQDAGLRNPLHVVTNGQEAIQYLAGTSVYSDRNKHPLPDLIFLDLKLPGIDGFEVLSWIRQRLAAQLPVAVLTSSSQEIDQKRARELGANCYLLKPPSSAMLLSCFRQFGLNPDP